jgi:hypothetical protein
MSLALLALALAAATDPTTAPPKPPLICRKAEKETGSHIRAGKKCLTAEEWGREDEARENKPAGMRVTEGQSTPTGAPGAPH